MMHLNADGRLREGGFTIMYLGVKGQENPPDNALAPLYSRMTDNAVHDGFLDVNSRKSLSYSDEDDLMRHQLA